MTTRTGIAFARAPLVDPVAYANLAQGVRDLLGIDLDQYRQAQVWRRVTTFGASRSLPTVDLLLGECRRDPRLLAELHAMLTINVSKFFRDPAAWDRLRDRLADRMVTGRAFRIWSAGCSFGYEPYSLAMLANELTPGALTRIVATDVDPIALAVGKPGHYTSTQLAGLLKARLDRFLTPDEDGWTFRPEVRASISFRQQDLLDASVGLRAFDLVVCRNVVIYFTDRAKVAVHQRLADALRPGGLLFVGATEAILRPQRFGLVPVDLGLYQREA